MPISQIMPGAAPYFHRGGPVGCLCLHGFTASPNEVLWLAQHLAGEGHTVYAPRLAGHGTYPADLARSTWMDWHASALDAYTVLRSQCEQVYICGLSMGGLLSLLVSMTEPVDGLVLMAVPILLYGSINTARWLKYMRPYADHTDRTAFPIYLRQQQKKRGEPQLGRVRYNRWSMAAIEQLLRLMDEVGGRLHEVTAPMLTIYSENDATVSLDHQRMIVSRVASQDVTAKLLKESGHILTQDVKAEIVFELVADFIAQRSTG